ncbi:MAG: aminoglycoside phosphotransferase family protein [Chloroflexi bacterium]|nr:aminoglycoside phosphotransferase family protein [Chloroflexota bacterium]
MLEEVVRQINLRHGTDFRLRGRYPIGEVGAFGLEDGDGTRFVLKWSPRQTHLPLIVAAARVTTQLRSLGYPAPSYVLWGALPTGCFGVQSALPGESRPLEDPAIVDQIVSLCDLQSGRGGWLCEAFPTRPSWAEEAVYAVTRGYAERDYCDIASLRLHSPATNELLCVVQTFVERHADELDVDHADIVHYDFSPANLLLNEQQRVVGVVDWEGVRAGDRLFDLATQLFYAPSEGEVHHRLRRAALERGRPGVLGIYLCHLIVRQVDFSIRHHRPAVVAEWLDHSVGVLSLLSELAR